MSFEIIKTQQIDREANYVYPVWVHNISEENNIIDYEAYLKNMTPESINLHTEENFIANTLNQKIKEFDIGKPIGDGGFSITYLARLKKCPELLVAIKTLNMKLPKFNRKIIFREIFNLSQIDNECVIKIYDFFNDGEFFYIVTEYAPYGDLYSLYSETSEFNEKECAYISYQIAESIRVCHSINMVHNDIKLENIVIGNNNRLKLIDFGYSFITDKQAPVSMICGTLEFMAPESFSYRNIPSLSADIWSFGVLIYETMCGHNPFALENDTHEKIKDKIRLGFFTIPDHFSTHLTNLILRCLTHKPDLRPTIDEVMNHPWFDILDI